MGMAGLVTYASSDEEDHMEVDVSKVDVEKTTIPKNDTNGYHAGSQQNGSSAAPVLHDLEAPIVGPTLGPSIMLPEAQLLKDEDEDLAAPPLSPYSANRALLRDLTLPTLPNYDIPPSPPGSPLQSTNAKFKHFLELKKQGVHFNDKLANSSALMNPGLMQKLMDFSDIDEAGQYATTLPKVLWNPDDFSCVRIQGGTCQESAENSKEERGRKVTRPAGDTGFRACNFTFGASEPKWHAIECRKVGSKERCREDYGRVRQRSIKFTASRHEEKVQV